MKAYVLMVGLQGGYMPTDVTWYGDKETAYQAALEEKHDWIEQGYCRGDVTDDGKLSCTRVWGNIRKDGYLSVEEYRYGRWVSYEGIWVDEVECTLEKYEEEMRHDW